MTISGERFQSSINPEVPNPKPPKTGESEGEKPPTASPASLPPSSQQAKTAEAALQAQMKEKEVRGQIGAGSAAAKSSEEIVRLVGLSLETGEFKKINRDEAEAILQRHPANTYLFRPGSRDPLVMSCKDKRGDLKHVNFHVLDNGKLKDSNGKVFDSSTDVISAFMFWRDAKTPDQRDINANEK